MSEKIKPHHLERKAILYVRQSSAYQVNNNLESQTLQYAMQARLRQLGWREVEIVDDDLGRSAAGTVPRSALSGWWPRSAWDRWARWPPGKSRDSPGTVANGST